LTLAPAAVGSSTLTATPAAGSAGSYTVAATATSGASSGTGTAGLVVTAAPAPPTAPSNLGAAKVSGAGTLTGVKLTWSDNSNNETGFRIERCTVSGSTCTYSAVTLTQANIVTFSQFGHVTGTTYQYRIRAENAIGGSAWIQVQFTP
jgi:hypothetical protein